MEDEELVHRDAPISRPQIGISDYLAYFIYGKRIMLYVVLSLGLILCFSLFVALFVIKGHRVKPHNQSLEITIYSLNNWAIPANEDKEQRLDALKVVLANETFDFFLLQGLWMNYDHEAIKESLPSHLSITEFRELASPEVCDGRITRAGCSGLSVVYRNSNFEKLESSFNMYAYRGSIFTTDGTLGKGIGRLRFKIKDFILEIFNTHVHDTEPYYQDLQTTELMTYVAKSPADLVILGTALQSKPDEAPYHKVTSYKVVNTAQRFHPSSWNNADLYGTFNMPKNKYTPKEASPAILDYVFAGSPLHYDFVISNFFNAVFSSISGLKFPLSNHETIGLTIQLST